MTSDRVGTQVRAHLLGGPNSLFVKLVALVGATVATDEINEAVVLRGWTWTPWIGALVFVASLFVLLPVFHLVARGTASLAAALERRRPDVAVVGVEQLRERHRRSPGLRDDRTPLGLRFAETVSAGELREGQVVVVDGGVLETRPDPDDFERVRVVVVRLVAGVEAVPDPREVVVTVPRDMKIATAYPLTNLLSLPPDPS
jgi:hypothetical protein